MKFLEKENFTAIEVFINELQKFDIDVYHYTVKYNGYTSSKLYVLHMKNAFNRFVLELSSKLRKMEEEEEKEIFIKRLLNRVENIKVSLQQNKDLLAYLEIIITQQEMAYFNEIKEKFSDLNINFHSEGVEIESVKEVDILSFTNCQIMYNFKILSFIYNIMANQMEKKFN